MSLTQPPTDLSQSDKIKWLTLVLTFFAVYASLRYIVFKGVSPVHFPLYIVNKVISVSGLFFLAVSYATGKVKWLRFEDPFRQSRFIKFSGLAGFSLSAMHVFISLIILGPAYFPKFYTGEMMNLTGELSMLMGVLSLYCFTIPAITTITLVQEAFGIKKWQQGQRMGYMGLLTAFFHATIMGFSGWFNVDSWPGYLPPITMISALIAIFPLYLKFLRKS
jgi:DMSO/TMAO reductase YedYZ heme-binding membrane subunit